MGKNTLLNGKSHVQIRINNIKSWVLSVLYIECGHEQQKYIHQMKAQWNAIIIFIHNLKCNILTFYYYSILLQSLSSKTFVLALFVFQNMWSAFTSLFKSKILQNNFHKIINH